MKSSLPAGVRPETPGPGQESVWDYPRPPRLERSAKQVIVRVGAVVIAQTDRAWRVLETSHPPTWYLPRDSILEQSLIRSSASSTVCEWKGAATYWDVVAPGQDVVAPGQDVVAPGQDVTAPGESVRRAAAWSCERPTAPFREIAGHLAFDPGKLVCEVDGETVRPQQGGFYAGWITDDVVGPFKGGPGSYGW
jgi:uncharacterized protein (DUF427 family)